MKVFETSGALLHFSVNVSLPQAKTLVFINSLGTDFRIWDDVVAELQATHNVILHDKRGHGLSTLGNAPVSIATYAEDLSQLLTHIGAKNVVLCGLSVGGLIAQHLVLNAGLEVKGLVLSNTALKIGSDDMWNNRIAAIESRGLDAIGDSVIERWLSPAWRAAQPQLTQVCRTMLVRTPVAGYLACCRAIRDAAAFDHHRSTPGVPTLCVAGSTDGSTPPALVRAMAENISASTYHEFEGAGHLPCIEQPKRYAEVIRDFAKRL
jgi:3-oxoadipate enol-lactonase